MRNALLVPLALLTLAGCATTFYVPSDTTLTVTIKHSSDFANFDLTGMLVNSSSVDAVEPFDVWTEAKGYALRTAPGREFSQAGKSVTITWTVQMAAYPDTPTRLAKLHWVKGHWGSLSIKVAGVGPDGKPVAVSTSVVPGPSGAEGTLQINTTNVEKTGS